MRSLYGHIIWAAAAIISPVVFANSAIRNPIGAISTVQNATIHTHNGRVTALSHFDLTFNIRDEVLVQLRLEPNHDILADDAQISYLAPDGTTTKQEGIDRLGHKVFKGSAWVQRPSIGLNTWKNVGWARIMINVDGKYPLFEGAFAFEHDQHHIQSSKTYIRTKHQGDPEIEATGDEDEYMVVWRDSDILKNPIDLPHEDMRRAIDGDVLSCSSDGLDFNSRPDHPVFSGMKRSDKHFGSMELSHLFGKRQSDNTTGGNSAGVNLVSTIGQTTGCPTTRKVALVGVATDCSYTAMFNSTQSVRANIISQMNTASVIWENALSISLGLQNLTVSHATCPSSPVAATEWNQACTSNLNIGDRLNLFSAWRGTLGGTNSHWTLLSTCNTDSTIGLAWLGQACVSNAVTVNSSTTGNGPTSGSQSETVTGANVVISAPGVNEWQILAHETGHTFGAVHDCDSQTCADANTVNSQQCCPLSSGTCNANAQYVMNPYATQSATHFSPCTIGNICSALGRNSVNTSCLTENKQITTISGQECGNGIVEPGEECDCGGTEGCAGNTCCNPTTCKYTTGSVCDPANDACCNSCQFSANGTICRSSGGMCDPQEVCTGTSAACPPNKMTPDGTSCGNGLQCASGECTSRDQQCKTVMGSYTQGNNTYACDDSGCAISCASPEFGSGVCYGLKQNYLDGTECGGGGTCQNVSLIIYDVVVLS